jgi:tetratricopeptide (TPR) repeat protein
MLCFKQLEARNEYASELVSFMAYVNPNDIPEYLLRTVNTNIDEAKFHVACGDLKALSFISTTPPDTVNIQPVLQSVMRMWLQRQGKAQHWSDIAVTTMANSLPAPNVSRTSWSSYERLVPHAQTLLEHAPVPSNAELHRAELLYKLAWYFRVRGDHDTAEKLGSETLRIRQEFLADNDEATLAAIHGLSRTLFEKGDVQQAESLQVPAVETCKQALGEEHAITLRSEGHLAAIRGTQHRYDEALLLQEHVLEVTQRAFPDSPETWTAMRDLAITYCYLDRQSEAARLQQEVLASRQHYLGENHPETLTIMSDLATTYTEQDRFEEAEWLLTKILERSNRVLGYQHPHTRAAYTSLKHVLMRQNKMDEVNRLDRIIGKIQLRRKQSRMQARGYRRPSAKRNISDSVVTYSYDRRQASLNAAEGSPDGATTRSAEVGLGLEMVRLSRDGGNDNDSIREERDGEEEEEGEDEHVDEDVEDFATVKLGLRAMMRGMMSLPMFNITMPEPNNQADEDATAVSSQEGTRSSDTLSPDPSRSQGRPINVGYRKSPGRSPVSLQRPTYSNSKFIRTVEKKIDRNVDMEAGAELWKSGRGLSKDLAANAMTAAKNVKLPWKPKSSKIREEVIEDAPNDDEPERSSEDLSQAMVTTTDALIVVDSDETASQEQSEEKECKKKSNRKSVLGFKF